MKTPAPRILGLAGALALLACAAPAAAQFEEPDSIPRFDAGIFFDLNFRGKRGATVGGLTPGLEVGFTNSPSGGLRLDYRITGTLTLGAFGSYTRVQEKTSQGGSTNVGGSNFNVFQFGGELLLRIKPRIPGYFILGGGAQYVNPEASDPPALTGPDSFTEPFGIVGAGYEFASTRRSAFRLNFRLYLVNPTDQVNYEPKSIEVDFVLGAAVIVRF